MFNLILRKAAHVSLTIFALIVVFFTIELGVKILFSNEADYTLKIPALIQGGTNTHE